jgi:hypothetical protein
VSSEDGKMGIDHVDGGVSVGVDERQRKSQPLRKLPPRLSRMSEVVVRCEGGNWPKDE